MKQSLIAISLLLSGLTGHALADTTIVQWGAPGGDPNIVTANQEFSFKTTTYTTGSVANPAVGASYYPNATGRSPEFNHASTTTSNTKNVTNDAAGDYISTAKNFPTYEAMVCWETFLTGDTTLRSLTAETRVSDTVNSSEFRWVIKKTNGNWYASDAITTSTAWTSYSTADPGGLTWHDFTPVTSGSATIGAVASIDMIGVSIVGIHGIFNNTTGNPWRSLQTRYFKATGSEPPIPLLSYDTGYTIMSVRSAMLSGSSVIVATSYEGTMLAMDYNGNILWTNPLTGYMVRDIWCSDLDNDGTDEVLAAIADGSVHCLKLSDGTSFWAQPFQPNEVPMNAVCTVRTSGTSRYVVCGGYDLNMYYLSASGTLINTIASSTYSDLEPWGDARWYLGRPIGKAHSINFLRPIPQPDGTDILAVLGFHNNMQVSGRLFEFLPLATTPSILPTIPVSEPIGSMRVVDPDKNGTFDLLLGTSSLTAQTMHALNRDTGTYSSYSLTNIGSAGYRVTQAEIIPTGNTYEYLMICGNYIILMPLDLNPAGQEKFSGAYAYNDMWRDPSNNRILLASSQSGGSSIHILDTSQPNWKTAFQNLAPPGKIQTIKTNFNTVRTQVGGFTRPAWERTPLKVTETQGDPANPLAVSLKAAYQNPVFLYSSSIDAEERSWRTLAAPAGIPNTTYQNKIDTRQNYVLTQQQVLDAVSSGLADSKASSGIAYWGGHGNDPYYYQPETSRKVLDLATARGQNQKTVMIWPEVGGNDSDFGQVLEHLFYPLAKHDLTGNFRIFMRNKDIYWQAGIHQPAWQRFISGEFKDAFVPALEETSDKTMELSLAGRLGLWASGCVDDWGMRCSRDNPSFDRARQHSYQRLANHFLRNIVHNLAYGSRYLNNHYVDVDHMSLAWELVATGALFVPKREEIVSFSPVHLGMTVPDERYLKEGTSTKWNVYYNAAEESANPMVFSRMNGTWLAAKTTDWDFSRYAAGVKERRQNFIPPYENGMVLITPVQNGIHAAPDGFRNKLVDNLHPLYKTILKEHISDGKNYIDSDSTTTHAANSAYQATVAADIQTGATQIPVTVSGEVAWVCAQSAPTHLRLTLVDSGYLNPKARTAAVSFHTVEPTQITDVLSGEVLAMTGPGLIEIPVPLGSFRFIDIELPKPFWPSWDDYKSHYGLSGEPDSDMDKDGQSDLVEFGLGGNPLLPEDTGTLPFIELDPDADSVTFRHKQRVGDNSGVSYVAEWSEDLAADSWNTGWSLESTSATADPEFAERLHRIEIGDRDRLFFRLRMTQP